MECQSAFREKLYLNAKTSLRICLKDEVNTLLKKEKDISIEQIIFQEDYVKIHSQLRGI